MSVMEHWQLAVTPLSPVHLGTGRDYTPTEYVIEGGALHEFDALAALQALPEAERRRLDAILAGRPDDRMLRSVQAFFHDNRRRLIAVSRHQVRVNATVEAFYQERVGQVAQHEATGRAVQNRLEIERTAWSAATGTAILPGSGMKGAIRTALLDQVNEGRSIPDDWKRDRQGNRRLQESLFEGSFERDPLRMLRISDAAVVRPGRFATDVRFALNRKKRPVLRGGQQLQSRAEQQGLYQLLECLPPFADRAFRGSLSIQDIAGVESPNWPARVFTFSEIAAACNRFYRAHFEREMALMKNMGYVDRDWERRLETLFASPVGKALDANRAFLLRVGRHSGAESVTLNGVRHIKILKGKGDAPDFMDEAKTLWLAGDERQTQQGLLPFGWMLVESFRDPGELADWPPQLRADDMQSWRERIASHRQKLAAELETERQREIERTRAEQEAERKERERAQRLASMSAEERQIDALLSTLAQEQAAGTLAPSSQVASARVDLLRTALDWGSEELRRQAADAIQQTVRALPWSKKSRAERQNDLARLRQPKDS
ncbi:CRISPR-associated protein, Csm5 family [Thioalkalivibrio nitratireducens DSM 14787]|uniref:CRISPR system Cms protein Csm5 n=1 Tax=Thioalkalivibrio nitratireducens (strain DSM 14787 / UNIQEM 213 / ALEN2) TaxID=1255043 RepID=L0DVS2_THIND|nr:RAMP superfamily CRISPR-associated protein [Thioalkalivibrio nitratireducens]AGA33133.1 CRISPR-associated protein, Csm5 family [Thioalkalivibrio nitratireducens DSM 14787]